LDKKKKHQSEDEVTDEQLFRQAVEGVVPLKTTARTDSSAPRSSLRNDQSKTGHYGEESDPGPVSETCISDETEPDAAWRKSGVRLKVMQQLKRGHFPPRDQFDLHHLSSKTARTALLKFITNAHQRGLECIRIIHGKGRRSKNGPRLKVMTRQVLTNHPQVMAYTACKPADGGDGATDVLLKS
jgi:DNA-nicking Smr family endonuclease